jgi:peptidoglycan/xylan/chitin deacetylase (PgdA/CDA1 family)
LYVTIDVEEHAQNPGGERFEAALQPLLDQFDAMGIRATFFVVGALAPRWRQQMQRLAAEGHEIGLHGHTHTFLAELGPRAFERELAMGREAVADATGVIPVGFSAPYFSLTTATPWSPDLIAAAGFTYSSSVLPAWNPQAGLRDAPRTPFRWSSGLVEFPAPVFGLGPVAAPLLGGAYLRLAPSLVVKAAAHRVRHRPAQWTYAHPYDFDVDEPFFRRDGQGLVFSKLLFARRRLMLKRVLEVSDRSGATLATITRDAAFVGSLPHYEIPTHEAEP